MRKMRKGKKMLLIFIIAIIVALVVLMIVNIVKNIKPEPEEPDEKELIVQLPETTYSDMEVRNVYLRYLPEGDQTVIEMEFNNTTDAKVEDENFNAILIGPNDEVLGQLPTHIAYLDIGDQYHVSVVMSGDLTQAKQVKLMKI